MSRSDLSESLNSPADLAESFTLGAWDVFPARGRLRDQAGGEHHVEPRVMDLLLVLARRAGDVVAKDVLIAEIWGNTHVAGDGLFRHVSELRRLLGDDARAPRYVETVPKRGYRLLVPPVRHARHIPWASPVAHRPARRLVGVLAAAACVLLSGYGLPERPLARRDRATLLAASANGSAAFEHFARGRVFDERLDCGSYRRGVVEYERAVSSVPQFAGAFNAYADALLASAVLGCQSTATAIASLDDLLTRASGWTSRDARLAFAPADGLRVAGARALFRDRDVVASGALLARAFAAGTGETDVLLAMHRVALGNTRQAVVEARKALANDPAALGENWAMSLALYFDRRFAEAIPQLRRTLELYPESDAVRSLLLLSLVELDRAAARALAKTWDQPPSTNSDRFGFAAAYVLTVTGDREYGRRAVAAWEDLAEHAWVPPTAVAALYGALDSPMDVVRWMRRAEAEGDVWLLFREVDPTLQQYRSRLGGNQ